VLAWLCLGNILYCGWVAMRQRDLNLLIGNSSVAHMGFASSALRVEPSSASPATVLVMIAHGFLAALTFGLSGYLRQQLGTAGNRRDGWTAEEASVHRHPAGDGHVRRLRTARLRQLPRRIARHVRRWKGLSSFVVVVAWGALIVGAIYALRAVRNILHGPAGRAMGWRGGCRGPSGARLPFALLLVCLLTFGVYPQMLTAKVEPGVAKF